MADISTTIPNLANQTKIANALTTIASKYEKICDIVYPVGSIYMSVSSTDPSLLFGGTWEQIQDRFLLASGSTYGAGTTGGEASHTLTEAELPNIKGNFWNFARQDKDNDVSVDGVFSKRKSNEYSSYAVNGIKDGYDGVTINFGSNQAHNNMPPYIAVYVWKRVS